MNKEYYELYCSCSALEVIVTVRLVSTMISLQDSRLIRFPENRVLIKSLPVVISSRFLKPMIVVVSCKILLTHRIFRRQRRNVINF